MARLSIAWLALLLPLVPGALRAEVRSSGHYAMDAETLNGGGGLSASADYGLEDSLEPVAAGVLSSRNYMILQGFDLIESTEIEVTGGDQVAIADGDLDPGFEDGTDFGRHCYLQEAVREFTVRNAGNGTLALEVPFVSGADATVFSAELDAARLLPGQFTTLRVRYVPDQSSIQSATVVLLNNDSDEGAFHFAVQGKGDLPPALTLRGAGEITAVALGLSEPLRVECDTEFIDPGFDVVDHVDPSPPVTVSGTVNTSALGEYRITYTAEDGCGNQTTRERIVVVEDTTPPQLALFGDDPLVHECATVLIDPGATATDTCAGNVTTSIVVTGSVDAHTLGEYILTYTANDGHGNSASIERTVQVVDTTPPSLTLLGDNPLELPCGSDYAEPGASVADTCDPAPVLVITGSVNVSVPGDYTLIYRATDGSGNFTEISRSVRVLSPRELTLQLVDLIESLNLPRNLRNALLAPALNALSAMDAGNWDAASNQLTSLANLVEAQRAKKKLTSAQADLLLTKITIILTCIEEVETPLILPLRADEGGPALAEIRIETASPAVYGTPPKGAARAGLVRLTWSGEGRLMETSDLAGDWTPVADPVSPYWVAVEPAEAPRYFRLER